MADTSGLKAFTDSVGRTAYVDAQGKVHTSGGATAYDVAGWNARQTSKYGSSNTQDPKNSNEVSDYLNNLNKSLYDAKTAPAMKEPDVVVPTMEEIKAAVTPEQEVPALINYANLREQKRETLGVADLEASYNEMNAAIRDTEAMKRIRSQAEEGKQVPMNVIAGRQTEVQRQENETLDLLTRQAQYIGDQLNTKYSIISEYMKDTQMTYQDAIARYDKTFEQNLSMYNVISQKESERIEQVSREIDRATEERRNQEAAARANLTTMTNLIASGNLDLESASSETKLLINKLEVQAGLPIGFMSSIKRETKDEILWSTTPEAGVQQVGFRSPDGTIHVETYGKPLPKEPAKSTESERQQAGATSRFNAEVNTLKPSGSGENTVGIFPQLVMTYASEMSLSQIYSLYNSSAAGKQHGAPKEDRSYIAQLYEMYK